MKFSKKLKKAMQQLGLNQAQVVGMTGKSKGSISMYLNDKTTPSEKVQSDIAVSLGLAPDYFEQEEAQVVVMPKGAVAEGRIKRMLPEEAAVFLGMDKGTVRKGLQQGVSLGGMQSRLLKTVGRTSSMQTALQRLKEYQCRGCRICQKSDTRKSGFSRKALT